MLNKFTNFDWALSQNHDLKIMVVNQYSNRERYLKYLDDLISELRNGNCKNIQEKIAEANDLSKFKSTIAELEISRILLKHAKSITFLPDNYMSGTSPDILAVDSNIEAYVEVKRLTEDEVINDV